MASATNAKEEVDAALGELERLSDLMSTAPDITEIERADVGWDERRLNELGRRPWNARRLGSADDSGRWFGRLAFWSRTGLAKARRTSSAEEAVLRPAISAVSRAMDAGQVA